MRQHVSSEKGEHGHETTRQRWPNKLSHTGTVFTIIQVPLLSFRSYMPWLTVCFPNLPEVLLFPSYSEFLNVISCLLWVLLAGSVYVVGAACDLAHVSLEEESISL